MLLGEPEQIQCYDFGLRGDKNKRTGSMHIASFILREREREREREKEFSQVYYSLLKICQWPNWSDGTSLCRSWGEGEGFK